MGAGGQGWRRSPGFVLKALGRGARGGTRGEAIAATVPGPDPLHSHGSSLGAPEGPGREGGRGAPAVAAGAVHVGACPRGPASGRVAPPGPRFK